MTHSVGFRDTDALSLERSVPMPPRKHPFRAKRQTGPLPRRQQTCIVLGGGLAGLSAAYLLSQKGWKVIVLEAENRWGGRVMSHRFPQAPDLVCELGGEWIGADHSSMWRLVSQFGLDTESHCYAYFFWKAHLNGPRPKIYQPGDCTFSPQSKTLFDEFAKKFRNFTPTQLQRLDQFDWWSQLQLLGFTHEELVTRDLMDSTDFGETIRLTSAFVAATEYIQGNASDEMDSKIVGGNSLLVDALESGILKSGTGSMYKKAEVVAIYQEKARVTAHLADGRRYNGDVCICALPAHIVAKINWDPALPSAQKDAANQLQYSRIMKTAVLYRHRFWRTAQNSGVAGFGAFSSRVSDFCFESTHGQVGKKGILCSYAVGDKADDLAGEDPSDVAKWITEDMLEATGYKKRAKLDMDLGVRTQPWQREPHGPKKRGQLPWTGGAYAFYRPGQWFSVRPLLAQPHGRVLFACADVDEDWQGFMEGAVRTGEAAANSL
jgi:monoamine oxidase